ncbi:DUF6879 family protein [Actinacidiphila bryophytorum]|uniref:DUF6879 family protein n=1 Tax=Actinacidiphila bryophytorum TaxID=1436133 RepID=UPI002176E471|nr:DUF6879 family protein [Actinacidiphila bryophytorum]UWE07368.1 hypothetical protein NYE86_00545 [Actinacidiphila bryophytorum]
MRAAAVSAVHLEMRDGYMLDDPVFDAWRADHSQVGVDDESGRGWRALVRDAVTRGVAVRRARIVSEPLSDYVRFEYDITAGHNARAGEEVRWLPRTRATGLALPGNDFWLFDGESLLVNHFSGSGDWTATEHVTEPDVVKLCATAFDAVWALAVPHADYRPR